MESHHLDPSLPGVRQLQNWVRLRTSLRVRLPGGELLEGSLDWQDPEFLALRPEHANQPVLIRRSALETIQPLE
jgi:host factor-I protein